MNRLAERLGRLSRRRRAEASRLAPIRASCRRQCDSSAPSRRSSRSRSCCRTRRRPPTRPDPSCSRRAGTSRPIRATTGLTDNWQSGQRGAGWEPVTVPHVAEAQHRPGASSAARSAGTGSRFTGPATARRPRLGAALRAGAAGRARLAQRPRARRPPRPVHAVRAAARPACAPGEPNTLVVRVDYRRSPELREGWWNWGGITRQVSLVARGAGRHARRRPAAAPRLRRVDVRLERARRRLAGEPQRERPAAGRHGAPAVARRRRLARAASTPRALRPGERVRVRFAVPVKGDAEAVVARAPRPLRRARSRRAPARQVVQVDRRRIGLRTVDVSDGMLRLNDRVLDLRGASIQEDIPGRGPALTDADIDEHRRGAQGARRERHARALPARPAPARPLRRGGHPRLEPGAGLPPRRAAQDAGPALARARRRARHDPRRAQPPVGHHALGRQRADDEARRAAHVAGVDDERRRARARPRPDAAGLDRHPLLPEHPAPDDLRRLRHARHQLLLRLVQGQGRPARRPTSTTSRPTCARCATSTPARRS